MKVKIGNEWVDPMKTPVCILLEPGDKENIAKMSKECTKYAVVNAEAFTTEEIFLWMDDKLNLPV